MLKFWKRPDADRDRATDDAPVDAPPPVPAPASTPASIPIPIAAPFSAAVAPAVPPADEPPPRAGWLSRLRTGLAKTGSNIAGIFVGARVDEALFEELETALLTADAGVDATTHLIDRLRSRAKRDAIEDAQTLRLALRDLLVELLRPLERTLDVDRHAKRPVVLMMIGVNGAGKTTSIGKVAKFLQQQKRTVMLAAGDTFRAAAREQLAAWGERNGVTVVAQQSGDPAAVVFDAIASAAARGTDVVIADTAGRLPTQLHLMDELKKIKRVIGKAPVLAGQDAPQEVLLVIDGNTGQNAIAQVRAFDAAVGLTGLIVTKLDGTAKGGVLAAIALLRQALPPIPVYFIGVGEGLDDLRPFVASEFADALLGD